MPNHVSNIITCSPEVGAAITRKRTPEEVENYWRKVDPDELIVDFAMVVPPPNNDLYNSDSCSHQHGWGYHPASPTRDCWYSWNPHFWGTKWNAYDADIQPVAGDLVRLVFDTAWSHPEPVIRTLSEKFPDEVLVVEFADEDLGSNCAAYKIKNGEAYDVYQPDYGDEALDFAARVKYGMTYAELTTEWEKSENA